MPHASEPSSFSSFAEFYPYYLSEHQDDSCRRLHYAGSSLVIALLLYVLFSAPDLSITQVLVETLTVIMLVLVLFRLPGWSVKSISVVDAPRASDHAPLLVVFERRTPGR